MRIVPIVLFLVLLAGCTTRTKTELVTQYQIEYLKPPAAYLLACQQPYHQPPKTWGDAALRDPVWLAAFHECAFKLDVLRHCYSQSDTPKQLAACLSRFGAEKTLKSGESSRVNLLSAPPSS